MPATCFLDIPQEIRAHILGLLLTRPCPVDVLAESSRTRRFDIQEACFATKDGHVQCCGYLKWRYYNNYCRPYDRAREICVGPLFRIELLRVCKQIYSEAVEILYTTNKFILTSLKPEDIPLSDANLLRVRSLQLTIPYENPMMDLVDYHKMIEFVRLNPNINLAVTIVSNSEGYLDKFATNLSSLAPVKSCSLSLRSSFSGYTKVRDLGTTLLGRPSHSFVRYNDLPKEIRYQILSYTDLVQDYQVDGHNPENNGTFRFGRGCCYLCSDTLDPCCCNHTAGSFSDRCTCKVNPLALLKVSSSFRAEALDIMFGRQSQFHFEGRLKDDLNFLRKIEPHLSRVRTITLTISWREMADWHYGSWRTNDTDTTWDDLVDYLISFSTLSHLSLMFIAPHLMYFDPYIPPSSASQWLEHQEYYGTYIPGFQKLIANGLADLKFQFLHGLEIWHDEYRALVFGGDMPATRITTDDPRIRKFGGRFSDDES